MHTFTAHQSRIRSISIDPENKALITGSIDGELKVSCGFAYSQILVLNLFHLVDLGCQHI